MLLITLTAALLAGTGGDDLVAKTESDLYKVERVQLPDGCVLEVGGLAMFSDGRLAVSTRRGQVWIVENPLAEDIADAKVTLFHEGLWEGLGLSIVDDEIYALQRGELSKLGDADGDGRCDTITMVANDWGVSGHYHEFAFGLPRDKDGNWWMGLNVSFGDPEWWHGRSTVPYRGWILRVAPDGTVTPWASGVRSPNGVAMDSKGRLLVTDNQGDWVASSPIYHIKEGAFYGHPKSLNWTEGYRAAGKLAHDEIPAPEAATGREPVAIWIPYKWSRSTGNLLEDTTGGKFGVPSGQFVVAELTNGMILRAGFEEVQGVTQGWIVPLRQKIGSVNRVFQAPDGTVFCGLTNRGWGGLEPADGLMRVRWTGADAMEYAGMKIVDADGDDAYGFELSFSQPLHPEWKPSLDTCEVVMYDYDYWWEYGSPERHTEVLDLDSMVVSDDRRSLTLRSSGLLPAMCARVKLSGVTSDGDAPLLHDEIAYTINQLPSGPKTNAYVAKMVPPPPSKGEVDAGVLRLSWGDALGQFESTGWELVDATLGDDPTTFKTGVGNGALVNSGEGPSDFVTRGSFGDAHVHFEFMLPKGGASGVVLPGLGTLALTDDPATCGGFGGSGDIAPMARAYGAAGNWYPVDAFYRLGSGDEPAFLDRVLLDGVVVQEGLEVSGTSGERGPIRFLGTGGPVALRNIQVKPLDRPVDAGEWTFLDVGATWDDWELAGDCSFEYSGDELIGKGALGYLWAPLEELGEVTLRARMKINANGAGALVVNASEGDDGVAGVALRLNASFEDGVLSGSLNAFGEKSAVKTELIAADTWVDVELDVREDGAGTKVTASLNGVVVNELRLGGPLKSGGLALRCDHDGTVMKVQNIRYRR